MSKPSVSKLDNGLTVIVHEDHASPVVAFNVWVNVGSGLELDGEAGISHVIEHMLFKGTPDRAVGQIANEIESAGGDINAYTTLDYTVYYVVLASRYFRTGLDVLSDAVINSSFDPLETKREKEVVLEEIKRGNDMPVRNLSEKVFTESFMVHPYRRPVIGFKETVDKFTRKRLLDFYHKWYVGENITLVVVGDIDKRKALREIERAFQGLRTGKRPKRRTPEEPPQRNMKAFTMAGDVNESHLEFAFHTPGITSDDLYPLDVLALILGQGESSVLYRNIKASEGLVHNINTYSFTPKENGLFLINCSLDIDKSEKAVGRIIEECFNISRHGISAGDLDKAKANLESDFIYQKETVQGQARELGFLYCMMGDAGYEKEYLKRIQRISVEDVQRVAGQYLVPSNLTLGILHPQKENKPSLLTGIKKTISALSPPPRRKKAANTAKNRSVAKKRSAAISSNTSRVKLDNGIVLLVRENHNCPVVSYRCVLKGGVRYEDESNSGISLFVAEMLTKGTRKRTAIKIARETEAIAGSLEGFAGRNSIGVYGEFLSKHFDEGLDLVSDILLHPTFRKGELEKKRRDVYSSIRQQQDNLAQLAFLEFSKTLYRKHPYGLNMQGSMESVSKFGQEMLHDFYRQIVVPDNLVVSIVGDVDAEEAVEKVNRIFCEMEPVDAWVPSIPAEPRIRATRIKEIFRDKEQAHVVLGFLGARLTDKDRYSLAVLNTILSGQGGRLFLELRDKMSLAYSVTSFSQEGIDPGFFGVYIATSPEKMEMAIEAIKRELGNIRDHKVSGAELERAKKFVTGSYEIDLQRCSSQSARLAFNECYGLGYLEMMKYPDKILKITAQDVQRAARRYLTLDRYVLTVIRPASANGNGD